MNSLISHEKYKDAIILQTTLSTLVFAPIETISFLK